MTSFKQSVNCLCSKDMEDVSLALAPVGRALKEKAMALKDQKCYELRHLEPMQVPPLLDATCFVINVIFVRS